MNMRCPEDRRAITINPKQWEALRKLGKRAFQTQCFIEAEKHLSLALKEAEKFGDKDERLVTSLSDLAVFYAAQGNYSSAVDLMDRAVTIGKRILARRDLDALIKKSQGISQAQTSGNTPEALRLL
ncbi:MAG TPA: tetratricopeptide repeat protein [Candidatus Obscuribacterales bacterium]